MKNHSPVLAVLVASVLSLAAFDAACAQAAKAGDVAAAADNEPQSTTASYGDWVFRCQKLPAGSTPARACEIAQSIQAQGQSGPIAELAVGRLKQADPFRMTLIVPVNVLFPSAVRIVAEDKPAEAVELTWRKCIPAGCIADVALKADQVQRFRNNSAAGTITWRDSLDREARIAVSFRWLAQALDALGREP